MTKAGDVELISTLRILATERKKSSKNNKMTRCLWQRGAEVRQFCFAGLLWLCPGLLYRFSGLLELSRERGRQLEIRPAARVFSMLFAADFQVGPILALCNGAFGMTSAALPLAFKVLCPGCEQDDKTSRPFCSPSF